MVESVAGLVMQASGSLVEVDILELSESPWPGVGSFHTRMGLRRQINCEGIRPKSETGNDREAIN